MIALDRFYVITQKDTHPVEEGCHGNLSGGTTLVKS